MNGVPEEVEIKLLIVSDIPAQLADQIAALRRLGHYILVKRNEERLHDIYWDRRDGRLSAERIALRLRTVGDETLITLKGPTKVAANGPAVRMEVEEPWSCSALANVRTLLEQQGLWPGEVDRDSYKSDPLQSLEEAGFTVVQSRNTSRRPRDLIAETAPLEGPVAELAVDITSFQIGSVQVLQREIEIEAKGAGGREAAVWVSDALRELFPGKLKQGNYSKLAMGKAIAENIDSLRTGGGLGPDGSLAPRGHDLLDAYLRGKNDSEAEARRTGTPP
jgi:inorganic triphosphatase YgiF